MGLVAGKNMVTVAIAQGGSAAATDLIAAPNALAQIVVIALSASLGATAGTIQWSSNSGNISGAQAFPINGGYTMQGGFDSPVMTVPKGEKLTVTSTGSGANGFLTYYITN